MALTLLVFILRAPYPGKRKSLGDARRERDLTFWPRKTCQENCLRIPVTIDGPGSFLWRCEMEGCLIQLFPNEFSILPSPFQAESIIREKPSLGFCLQDMVIVRKILETLWTMTRVTFLSYSERLPSWTICAPLEEPSSPRRTLLSRANNEAKVLGICAWRW